MLRSIPDTNVFLICGEVDAFADLSRQAFGTMAGHAARRDREPESRLALARDRYALVKCELAVFKPEA